MEVSASRSGRWAPSYALVAQTALRVVNRTSKDSKDVLGYLF